MSSRHLLDPELTPLLDAWPPVSFEAEGLAAVRDRIAEMMAAAPAPITDHVEVSERRAPGGGVDGAGVRILLYRPKGLSGPLPVLLHIHGGGFVMGDPDMVDALNRERAAAWGCVIASVDYRLAPETPFPGPLEDCYAALSWLHAEAGPLGLDGARIAVGGESAGGGLAAALALLARDRNEIPLSFQMLIYPMLDDRTGTPSGAEPHPYAGEFIWTASNNAFGWRAMIAGEPGGDDVSPYCAPARAVDLAGLPPAFIAAGALDLFIEEDLDFARRLIRAGVPVELHIWPGAPHGFDNVPGTWAGRAFSQALAGAARRALRADGIGP